MSFTLNARTLVKGSPVWFNSGARDHSFLGPHKIGGPGGPARLYWETAAPARLSPARIYLSTSPVPHNHICSEKMMFREIKVEQEEGEGREREGKKGE